MATIGMNYIKSCVGAASNKNIDTNSLIAMAGIPMVNHQVLCHRISDNSMVLLLNSLVARTADGFFGFAAVPVRFFPLMIQAFHYDQTIEQVIATMKTAFELAGCQLDSVVDNGQVTITLNHCYDDPDNFLSEFLLVFIHRMLSWLANHVIDLTRATVRYFPVHYDQEFDLLFRCPVRFNQATNSLVFKVEVLALASVRQPNEFFQVIEKFPLGVLQFPGEEQRIHLQIAQLLLQNFTSGQQILSASEVASRLSISTATLRRHLALQATSFGEIKADFLKVQAIKLLTNNKCSIEKVASLLGYSEARAFSRAFKLWSGLTPSQYRSLS